MSNDEDDEDDEDDEGDEDDKGVEDDEDDEVVRVVTVVTVVAVMVMMVVTSFVNNSLPHPCLNRFHWYQYRNQLKRPLSSVTKSFSLSRAILDS